MNTALPLTLLLISGVSSGLLKCPQSDGKFPIQNSLCKSYYVCENWITTSERTCPPGQNFDPVRQRCDYEDLYYCVEDVLQKYKRCKKAAGKFPKENSSCRGYYQCEKWKVTGEFACPPRQNFNPEQQWCDWEEIYPCLEDQHSLECPKASGRFPKPGSLCKSYYQCINGKPYEVECPSDMNFDPVGKKCEWPELYPCEETKESTTTVAIKSTSVTSTPIYETSVTEEPLQGTDATTIYKTTTTEVSAQGTGATTIYKTSATEGSSQGTGATTIYQTSTTEEPSQGTDATTIYKTTTTEVSSQGTGATTIYKTTTTEVSSQGTGATTIYKTSATEGSSQGSGVTTIYQTSTTEEPSQNTDATTIYQKSTTEEPSQGTDATTIYQKSTTEEPSQSTDASTIYKKSTTEELSHGTDTTQTIKITEGHATVSSKETTADKDIEQKTSTTEGHTSTLTVETSARREGTIATKSTQAEDLTTLKTSRNTQTVATLSPTGRGTSDSTKGISPKIVTHETKKTVGTTEGYTLTSEEILLGTKTEGNDVTTMKSTSSSKEEESSIAIDTERTDATSESDTKYPTEGTTSEKSSTTIKEKTTKTDSYTTARVSTYKPGKLICPKRDGLYPHPTNKHKFLSCVNYVPFEMNCPSDLIYDPMFEVCTWDRSNHP